MLFQREKPRRAAENAPGEPSEAREPREEPKQKVVFHWLNSAKGIGVLLVILGHLLYKCSLTWPGQIIYAFHMPMFFLISGFTQKPKLKQYYLLDKARRLLIPYLCYTLISVWVFSDWLLSKEYTWPDIWADAFYLHGEVCNNPLWFLIVLFEVYCLFALFHWVLGHWAGQLILCAAAFGAGYWFHLNAKLEVTNTLGFNRAVVCFGFFLAGMLLRHLHTEQVHFWHWLLLPPLAAGGVYFAMAPDKKISLYLFNLRIYPYFLLGALLLSVAVLLFCRLLLDRPGYLAWLSRYSILFLGTQFLWIRPAQIVLKAQKLLDTPDYYRPMFSGAAVYILLAPLVYELLKKVLPITKLLNGESL